MSGRPGDGTDAGLGSGIGLGRSPFGVGGGFTPVSGADFRREGVPAPFCGDGVFPCWVLDWVGVVFAGEESWGPAIELSKSMASKGRSA